MKKIHLFAILLVFSGATMAQDNNFLLYSFKGNVSVVENNVTSPAKIGKMLSSTSSLKLSSGASVTLICDEAAMFTITKPGNFAMNKLGDSCRITGGSFSSNYVKYVWAQMTSHEGSPGSNRKLFMNTVGAVSRSINNIWIDPRLEIVNYTGGEFPLSWKSYADAKEFEFFLYDKPEGGTPLYKTVVSKMKISIPSFSGRIRPGATYYWTSAIKGEDNDEIKVLNFVEKPVYEALLNKIKSEGPAFETPAEQAYRIAFALEDSHYLADAYQYYMKAATLNPEMALYRSTLMSFKKDYEIK